MGAEYLYELCDTLLDIGLDAISEERTGRPPPDRVFVSHGPTEAQGCPNGQLTVHADPVIVRYSRSRTADPHPQGGPAMPEMTMTLRLFRCVQQLEADGNVPAANVEDDYAREMFVDGWALATGVWTHLEAFSTCDGVKLGDLVPLPSRGAYGGWALSVTVGLSDGGPE